MAVLAVNSRRDRRRLESGTEHPWSPPPPLPSVDACRGRPSALTWLSPDCPLGGAGVAVGGGGSAAGSVGGPPAPPPPLEPRREDSFSMLSTSVMSGRVSWCCNIENRMPTLHRTMPDTDMWLLYKSSVAIKSLGRYEQVLMWNFSSNS